MRVKPVLPICLLALALLQTRAAAEEPPPFLAAFGAFPTVDAGGPFGIALDQAGNVYATLPIDHGVQVYSSTGTFLRGLYLSDGGGNLVEPYGGVTVDPAGNVYAVTPVVPAGVFKYSSTGALLLTIPVVAGGWFRNGPERVAIDVAGNIFVTDSQRGVAEFSPDGTFLLGISGFPAYGIAIDHDGSIFVMDNTDAQLRKFDKNLNPIWAVGSPGAGPGQFSNPEGVAVDSQGNLYVADTYNHRIQKLDHNGNFLTMWGTMGSGDGQFQYPTDVAVDAYGHVYVADSNNHRVQVFGSLPTPAHRVTWGSLKSRYR